MNNAWITIGCALLCAGCGWQRGEVGTPPQAQDTPIQQRRASVIAETCLLSSAQLDALAQTAGRVRQVALVCAQARDDGTIQLAGGASREAIQAQSAMLRDMGVEPRIALTYGAGPGMPGDPKQASARLADSAWRHSVVQALAELDCNGFELALPQLENASRPDVTAFVAELSEAAPVHRAIGVFAPPSMTEPSDLPGGDAYDLVALRPYIDRVRLMTLDYSCCGAPPGPTIDPWWASTVARLAGSRIPETLVDITVPLYGVHFSASGLQYVSHVEAVGLGETHGVKLQRSDSQTPFFTWEDNAGWHSVWFDDTTSILAYMRFWNPPELSSSVGVAFYGLGAEDASLWQAWQEAER